MGTSLKRRWWIYVLRCPTSLEVRYVGKTFNPKTRLNSHLGGCAVDHGRCHLKHWLQQLKASDLRPLFEIIDAGMGNGWGAAERAWIKEYRLRGAKLVNSTDGGEGAPGYSPGDDTRAKMSAAKKNRPLSPTHARNVRLALVTRNQSKEQRAALSAHFKGRAKTEEQKKKISATLTGKKQDPEMVARRAAAQRGRKNSPEAIERMRQAARKSWARRRLVQEKA